MKRISFVLVALFMTISCRAVSLFPFFGDLVGDYFDGPVTELVPLGVECLHSDKSHWFNSIADADIFLDDVLPYENYSIARKKFRKDGINMELYVSPLLDGRFSVMCLIELPEKGLYVIYDELPEDPLKVE